jgi:acetylornithine deacetylase/succinyl-diaminopimelate desuccinylase-like protein
MNPSPSSRAGAIARAWQQFDSGRFTEVLARRVAIASCSQEASAAPALQAYLADELLPSLQALGFEGRLFDNPAAPAPGAGPFLVAHRHEGDSLPTVLSYAHGDVIRGQDASWTQGAGPWTLAQDGERLYGRGTADNKGQHSINLAALEAVLQARGGRLGFNLTLLVETGEETGSPGLAAFCAAERDALKADVFIASDGPRVARDRPTLFMGSRGVANFTLALNCRDGAHHSGNWGGLLRNPGTVMASAIASLVDGRGVIRVPALRPLPIPTQIPATVREALAGLRFGGDAGDPVVDADWGEPGLTPAERVIAWNTLEVLAFETGNPRAPVNAIPPRAVAHMHLRFVVGTETATLREAVQQHLAAHGFGDIEVSEPEVMAATRLDPRDPWVDFVAESVQRSTGQPPVRLPNLGGSLPNEVFAEVLGLPTVWLPHSYAACNQHAPNEHLLAPVAREALGLMAGLWWDLGEGATPAALPAAARASSS